MKPRARPISNLYFRWGKGLGLSAEACAAALVKTGLIELISDGNYREVIHEKVPLDEYERTVNTILTLARSLNSGRD